MLLFLSLFLSSPSSFFRFHQLHFVHLYRKKANQPTYIHKILVLLLSVVFFLDFVFFLFFSFFTIINNLLPIQRRSHGRKKTSSNTKTLYINLFAHVYFLFFCFGLCWTSCLSVSFSFFLSFEKLQSSDMYVCVCLTLFLSVFFTCTCVYDDELVFDYK